MLFNPESRNLCQVIRNMRVCKDVAPKMFIALTLKKKNVAQLLSVQFLFLSLAYLSHELAFNSL